jgi:MoxR-like ATPase
METQTPQNSEENEQFSNRIDLSLLKEAITKIKAQLRKVIVGQDDFVELLLVSLLADGHVLIEGVPGVAKTITAKLVSKTVHTAFSRIQFTPDLMPSDVLGTSVLNMKTSDFEFKKGPIFSNLVLIDEINRAPAKTQAALFEVMEEKQITIDGHQYKMKPPFMVLATQNPIEQEGTYALPEAQLDRFLFKIHVGYPNLEEEIAIINNHNNRKGALVETAIEAVLTEEELLGFRAKVHEIIVEEKIVKYIAEIILNTRTHPHLYLGGSPRASIAVLMASKAFAAINGRDFVIPEDIKKSLFPVLRHRVILTPEREMEGYTTDKVIEMIIQTVEVPR